MGDLFLQADSQNSTVVANATGFLDVKSKAKELVSQINWIVTQRKIEYVPELITMKNHTSVQVRRKAAQGVGFLAVVEDIDNLKTWQLGESDRETWLILESAIDKIQRGRTGQNLEKAVHVLSVSEALGQIKRTVSENQFVIEGEVVDVQPIKQIYYFGLKDKQDSRLNCMVFAGSMVRAGFPLNEGLSVRITGKFKIGQKQARLYFDVESIQLTGEGELLRNLKLLEEKLSREGLLDPNRKRPIPKLPKNILLLASENSAAYTDYLRTLKERRGGVNIYLLPIKTQGVGAEYELLEKLDEAHQLSIDYNIDLIVLTRGGGSSDDLMVFNSEKVVRAVHGLGKPTIVAIGHERDTSLAELVADLRASTPTRAAELSSMSWGEVQQELSHKSTQFRSYLRSRSQDYISFSQIKLRTISNLVNRQISDYKTLSRRTSQIATSAIGQVRLMTQKLWQNLYSRTNQEIQNTRFKLSNVPKLEKNLGLAIEQNRQTVRSAVQRIYELEKQNINFLRDKLSLVSSQILLQDPKNVLKKGYVIARQNQKVVDSVSKLKEGETEFEFWDGTVSMNRK